jgi:uncharacterized alkaline shock family protein YloU
MSSGKRALLAIVGLIVVLAGFLLIFFTLGFSKETTILGHDLGLLVGDYNYTALGFLALLVGVLMTMFFGSRGKKKENAGSVVSYTDLGEISISFKAVENMVLTASRAVKGVREIITRIDSTEQGLIIYLRVKTLPDLPIPELIKELQEKVRDYVQEISGTNVVEIKVKVENIVQEKIQKQVR